MIYELRVYDVVPGKMPALHDRIANHVLRFFQKHGIKPVGYWTEEIGATNRLTYLLAFEDLAERAQKFDAFMADEEYQDIRAGTELDGPLVARATNSILKPTPYSPLK